MHRIPRFVGEHPDEMKSNDGAVPFRLPIGRELVMSGRVDPADGGRPGCAATSSGTNVTMPVGKALPSSVTRPVTFARCGNFGPLPQPGNDEAATTIKTEVAASLKRCRDMIRRGLL